MQYRGRPSSGSKLLLFDAFSILFRGHFGMTTRPMLRPADGRNVSGLYSLCNTLLRETVKHKPTHVAVCMDLPKRTFRKTLYADYKANRVFKDEKLLWQLEKIPLLTEALRLPLVSKEGFEADDIIGSLSQQAKSFYSMSTTESREPASSSWPSAPDHHTIIVSYDKDFLQLVDQHTSLLKLNGKSGHTMMTPEEVVRLMGITTEQVVDYMSMMGDAADNIPGVSSIGPKTAAKLLNTFKTADEAMAAARRFVARAAKEEPVSFTASTSKKKKQKSSLLSTSPSPPPSHTSCASVPSAAGPASDPSAAVVWPFPPRLAQTLALEESERSLSLSRRLVEIDCHISGLPPMTALSFTAFETLGVADTTAKLSEIGLGPAITNRVLGLSNSTHEY